MGMKKLWVVKAGSSIVVEGGPLLLRTWMQQVATLRREHNTHVIWVTSGAIASARTRLQRSWSRLAEKQALSALGQPIIMDSYNLALNATGLMGAQVLLTYDDMLDRKRKTNLKNTLNQLLAWDVVPVLNENDAVATEEIQFGDNDALSAKVAGLVEADRLVILTNVDGLFSGNPQTAPAARLIHQVKELTPQMMKSVSPTAVSESGTGGMYSKLKAARLAQKKGIPTWLLRGDEPDGLLRVARGEKLGTQIFASRKSTKTRQVRR
jgi:glutamate 5-kinase